MNTSRTAQARGGALVLAVIFITALSILTLGFMTIATATTENSGSAIAREQAFRMAETALADYIQRANKAGGADRVITTNGGTITVNYLPTLSYSFTYPGQMYTATSGNPAVTYTYFQVRCSGTVSGQAAAVGGPSGTVTRYIEAWVRSKPGLPGLPVGGFPAAAFGKASVSTFGNSTTDSFNSALTDSNGVPLSYSQQISAAPAAGGSAAGSTGAFHASPTGGSGNVGSNGSISVAGSYSIFGNLNPGPGMSVGGSPPGPKPSGITGSVVPLAAPISLPDPAPLTTPPAAGTTVTVNGGNVSASGAFGGTALTMPSLTSAPPNVAGTNGQSSIFHVQSISNAFQVKGNVIIYLDGDLSLSGMHNFISITPNATLTIYQGAGTGGLDIHGTPGILQVDSSGNALAYQLPNRFNFISSSSGSQGWHGNSDFAANVYAPNASVDFTGNGNRLGAVIANTLSIGGGSTLHEDLNAQSPAFATPPSNPLVSINSTREVSASTTDPSGFAPLKE